MCTSKLSSNRKENKKEKSQRIERGLRECTRRRVNQVPLEDITQRPAATVVLALSLPHKDLSKRVMWRGSMLTWYPSCPNAWVETTPVPVSRSSWGSNQHVLTLYGNKGDNK